MKKYYYVDKKGQQAGPVPVDQLLKQGITANTYVWCVGMANWEKAGKTEGLKSLFTTNKTKSGGEIGSLFPEETETVDYTNCPDNNLTWAAVSAISFWPLAIIAIVKALSVKKQWKAGKQEQAAESAKQAKNWAMASIITGAVIGIVSNIIMLIACIAFKLL
jgi:hypothetical protein